MVDKATEPTPPVSRLGRQIAEAAKLHTELGVMLATRLRETKTLDPAQPPFAGGAGLDLPAPFEEDPFKALDELMAVVEALCPEWPAREPSVDGGKMLL